MPPPVTLDMSKAQPLTLDMSRAQPLDGAPPQGAPPQGGAPQDGGAAQPPRVPESGLFHDLLGDDLSSLINDPSQLIPDVGHSPAEFASKVIQRIKDAPVGALRGIATGEQHAATLARDVTGTRMFDKGIDARDAYLASTAPKTPEQQGNYTAGDQIAGMYLTKWIHEGLTAVEIAKNMKPLAALTKLAEENPHIAKIIGAGLKSGTANAATTGILGGSMGDVANAGITGGVLGSTGELPNARADYATEAAAKFKPDVTNIGGQTFTEVSKAASDKGITTQAQEPGLQEKNRQSYETLRDQGLRARAAQGTAATVNAMEPEEPPVSVAGAQRLRARTAVSTAPPEKANTDASPREQDMQQRYLQKIIDSKKFPQAIKDKAQTQLDRISTQQQAVTDFRNNPDNYRTDTPIDPKVLMQNSTNFGEFAEELNRQAERRTQDFQWHQRQYESNGDVKVDANGDEVWKPVDLKTMSRSEQDGAIADGDLAKKDTRNLSKVDVQQGQRLSEIAEAAQQLDDETQAIYDLSRPRVESVQQQTGQPNLRQERRTADLQGHIDKLEKLAKDKAPQFKDMFGRKDGITDLIAAAKKISYADNGAKYSGTLGDYFLKTLRKRTSLGGKGGMGAGIYVLGKALGLKGTVATLGTEAAAEATHRSFMHRIATDPDFANKVLTKDRSPITPLRITSSTLANLGTQTMVRDDVNKNVQGGDTSTQEGID